LRVWASAALNVSSARSDPKTRRVFMVVSIEAPHAALSRPDDYRFMSFAGARPASDAAIRQNPV
jgi:hypothetical protein